VYLCHGILTCQAIQFNTLHTNVLDKLEICAVLGYYATSCGNCLPMFQNNIVPYSRVMQHHTISQKSADLVNITLEA
jgi:hypothetical protein